MKPARYIIISLFLSVLLHILMMLILSQFAFDSADSTEKKRPTKIASPLHLHLQEPPPQEEPKSPKSPETQQANVQKAAQLQEKTNQAIAKIFEQEQLSVSSPSPKIRFAGIEKATLKPKLPEAPAERQASAPRPKIVEINLKDVPPQDIQERDITSKVERLDIAEVQLPSLLPHSAELTPGVSATYDVGLKMRQPKFGIPNFLDEDEQNQPTEGLVNDINAPSHNIRLNLSDKNSDVSLPFDDFVTIEMLVKDDPQTGGGYYMITIKANEKCDAVREIAKDILLIIDRSSSISPKKFKEFKQASINALAYLNPNDNFNVVTFTDKPFALFDRQMPANGQNIEKARTFIRKLSKGGTTSVFDALQPFVAQATQNANRPLNIFMLTDGISTVNIYADDDFLRQISHINPGHISIFPFCAGDDANRDLLDFLGFLNRGSCLHAPTLSDVNKNLIGFIANHSNLLIRDLETISDRATIQHIYPKKLQHLYRNSNVKIFGHFEANETQILLNIAGFDSNNRRRDLIFNEYYANCKRTTLPIDSMWGARKILYLLAEKIITKDEKIKKQCEREIRKTSNQFNLAVPY